MEKTFSAQLKTQLCETTMTSCGFSGRGKKDIHQCCLSLFLRAALIFGASGAEGDCAFLRSSNELFLELCEFMLIRTMGEEAPPIFSYKGNLKGIKISGSSLSLLFPLGADSFFTGGGEIFFTDKLCPLCKPMFLRGAFLASGTVLNPEKGIHLEITCGRKTIAEALRELMTESGVAPKITKRGDCFAVYIKEGSKLEDFLTIIGAQNFALKIMENSIMNDVRNTVNRQNNSDNANLSRNVEYTMKLLEKIAALRESGDFASLPPKLAEAASLREKYPDDTLSELSARTDGMISKSGLSHRFKKLMEV